MIRKLRLTQKNGFVIKKCLSFMEIKHFDLRFLGGGF